MMYLNVVVVFFLGLNLLSGQIENDSIQDKVIHSNQRTLDSSPENEQAILLLNNKNQLLETALASNSNIFDSITLLFSIITIILTFLAIFIPVFNYLYVIKPNKKLKKRLEQLEIEIPKKIKRDFELFYKDYEKNKFKKFVLQLEDKNNYSDLADFVDANHPFFKDFDDEDQRTIVRFFKKNIEVQSSKRAGLNRILIDKPSEIGSLYYKEIFEGNENENYPFALVYLIDNGSKEHFNFLKKEIINSSNGHLLLLDILEYTFYYFLSDFHPDTKKQIGKEILMLYLNNTEISDSLSNEDFPESRKSKFNVLLNVFENTHYNRNIFITDTVYYKLFLKKRLKKPTRFLKI